MEVSTDGGRTWQEASTRRALSPHTWVLWTRPWEPAQAGLHTIQVRAVDGTGDLQTAEVAEPFPSGATGYHTIRVVLE